MLLSSLLFITSVFLNNCGEAINEAEAEVGWFGALNAIKNQKVCTKDDCNNGCVIDDDPISLKYGQWWCHVDIDADCSDQKWNVLKGHYSYQACNLQMEEESEVGRLVNVGAFSALNSVKNTYVCSKKDCITKCKKDQDLVSTHHGEKWCNVKIDQDCTDQKYSIVRGHYSYQACNSMEDDKEESEVGRLVNIGAFSALNSVKNTYVCTKKDCTTKCRMDNDLLSTHHGEKWCNVKINQDCTDQKYSAVRGHYSYHACNAMEDKKPKATEGPKTTKAPLTSKAPKPKKTYKPYHCYAYRKDQDDDWCKTKGYPYFYTGGANKDFEGCGACVCCQAITKKEFLEEDVGMLMVSGNEAESEVGRLVNIGAFSALNSVKNTYVCTKKDCTTKCKMDSDLLSTHHGEKWCNVKINQDCTDQKYSIVRGHYSYQACKAMEDKKPKVTEAPKTTKAAKTTKAPKPKKSPRPYQCYAYRKNQDDEWCKSQGSPFFYTGGANKDFEGCGACVCCQARQSKEESEVGRLVNVGAFSALNSVKNTYVCSKKDCITECKKDQDLVSTHHGEKWCNVKIDQDCTDQKYSIVRGHYSYQACNSMEDTKKEFLAAVTGSSHQRSAFQAAVNLTALFGFCVVLYGSFRHYTQKDSF